MHPLNMEGTISRFSDLFLLRNKGLIGVVCCSPPQGVRWLRPQPLGQYPLRFRRGHPEDDGTTLQQEDP